MDWNTYQQRAMLRVARPAQSLPPEAQRLIVAALGAAGESGEIADHIKKWVAQGHPLDKKALLEEAGDVLWYLALLADCLDTTLEAVAMANDEKLAARYPDGFSTERSLNR